MKNLVITLFIVFLGSTAFAKDGSSGCGPGWYVAKKNSLVSSSIRGTTNGFLGPTVTIGMTFGTSNCARHSIVRRDKEELKFATENYHELAADSAKGQGPFLQSYGEIMGCSAKSLQHFQDSMKENFKTLFFHKSSSPETLLEGTQQMILKDKKLAQGCLTTA